MATSAKVLTAPQKIDGSFWLSISDENGSPPAGGTTRKAPPNSASLFRRIWAASFSNNSARFSDSSWGWSSDIHGIQQVVNQRNEVLSIRAQRLVIDRPTTARQLIPQS